MLKEPAFTNVFHAANLLQLEVPARPTAKPNPLIRKSFDLPTQL